MEQRPELVDLVEMGEKGACTHCLAVRTVMCNRAICLGLKEATVESEAHVDHICTHVCTHPQHTTHLHTTDTHPKHIHHTAHIDPYSHTSHAHTIHTHVPLPTPDHQDQKNDHDTKEAEGHVCTST